MSAASGRPPDAPVLVLVAAKAIAGTTLLLGARRVVGALPGHRTDRVTLAAARVIGARNLIEAGLLWQRPDRRRVLLAAAIDGVHAGSMAALAILRPEEAAPALTSASGALAMSGTGIVVASHMQA